MSTEASLSAPGSSPMSPTAESLSLGQLISALTTRLTELEKLGLLSGYGKRLMSSLVEKVIPTPFTDGPVLNQGPFGMSMSHPDSGWRGLQEDCRKSLPEGTITCQSRGQTSLAGTPAHMTLG